MIRFSDIKSVLEGSIVNITFQSLVSGEERVAKCTLNPIYFNNKIKQSESDSILVYRLDKNKWDDIKLNTILKYEVA
jgi:hypothetical protein